MGMLKASHMYILPARCRYVIFVVFIFLFVSNIFTFDSHADVITPFLGTYFVITYILAIYKFIK